MREPGERSLLHGVRLRTAGDLNRIFQIRIRYIFTRSVVRFDRLRGTARRMLCSYPSRIFDASTSTRKQEGGVCIYAHDRP